ncbi:MAG: hypothetical protein KIH09_07770 [Candidatus Freyarchaeota archaeon]|nr:hypothetical protein [Candidatus Jordarchaeia archaeon]
MPKASVELTLVEECMRMLLGCRVENFFARRRSYLLIYIILIILNMFGYPLASRGYALSDTGRVISSLLSVSTIPYEWLAPIFHVATIILLVVMWRWGAGASRIFAVYVGANYIFIAFAQTIGVTLEFGLVILVGAFISYSFIGLLWFWDAAVCRTEIIFRKLPLWRYWPIPLAISAFWSPINVSWSLISSLQYSVQFMQLLLSNPYISWMIVSDSPMLFISIQFVSNLFTLILMSPNFNPLFLLTSSGYGLTFCMTTPVFLCLLTLFYPQINELAYKITAFVGIIYGVLNMPHLFSPYTVWMGVLHFPLLFISIYALILSRILKEKLSLEAASPKKSKY